MTSAPLLEPADPLARIAKGVWWLVLLRGILAILFGVIALLAPGAALSGIAIVFGVYALFEGVAAITHAIADRKNLAGWGWLLAQGVIAVLAGLAVLLFPGLAGSFGGLVVLWTIAIYALMHGISGLVTASRARAGSAKTWGIVGGVVTVLFGILYALLILLVPGVTLLGLIWVVGIYTIIFGVMLIIASVHLRKLGTAAA
jgi:uncharacterized membrane protein HdeD (DUF308 family)